MSLPAGNLLRIGMSHHPTMGWSGSILVHGVGALVATVTFVAALPTQPKLIGQRTAAEIELAASFTLPPEPVAVDVPTEKQVVVLPDRVYVADQTFFQQSTDVSNPTPSELALVDRLLAQPPAVPSRHDEIASPAEAPPHRQVARQSRPADVVTIDTSPPQVMSVGTTEQTPPRLLSNRPPTYPEQALVDRLEGTVVLRLHIAADGHIAELEIYSSSGHAVLDAAAARAVRTWQFAPATLAGQPTATTVRLPVRFSLDEQ